MKMKRKKTFNIGELSRLFNVSTDSIRYYEKIGILNPLRNQENNYRVYTLSDIRQLTMIRELLGLDFSTERIKEFDKNQNVETTKTLLTEELNIVNQNIVELFEKRIEQLRTLLKDNESKLILLGDFIDRGNRSFDCLKLAFELEQEFGRNKVVVLKGNHEVWFEEFLFLNEDVWLEEDKDFLTSGTFLTKEQFKELDVLPNREVRIEYVKKCIKEDHKELLV